MGKIDGEKGLWHNKFILFLKRKILNLKTFNKILFFLLIILGLAYVAGTNNLAIQGFVMGDLKEQRNKLAAENKRLELKAMTLSSYNIISGKISGLKMVAVGEIDYLNGANEAVAKK